jgi:hypothetical protein
VARRGGKPGLAEHRGLRQVQRERLSMPKVIRVLFSIFRLKNCSGGRTQCLLSSEALSYALSKDRISVRAYLVPLSASRNRVTRVRTKSPVSVS